MQLSENQINAIREKYYEKYGGEKNFPTYEDNPHYYDIERELLVFVQKIKEDCFVKCSKHCLSSEECRNEKNKTSRFALTASRKQLSQLLHNHNPIKHARFYEGFVELCCRFIGIDWDEFKKQSEFTSSSNLAIDEIPPQNDEKGYSESSSIIPNRIIGDDSSKEKGSKKNRKINFSKLNFWKWATILCIALIATMLFFMNSKNKAHLEVINSDTNSTGIVDSVFIKVFEQFHNAIISKDWKTAWELTDSTWRHSEREIFSEQDFYRYYRMTKSYHFIKYENHESQPNSFYATYEFIDDAPKLDYSKNLTNFSNEIFETVVRFYEADNSLKNKIDSLIKNKYSVIELYEYNLPDRIAIFLKLPPRYGENLFQDPNPRQFRVKMQVTMNYYNDGWKIHRTYRIKRQEITSK